MAEEVKVSAIWLRRIGPSVIVSAEIDGCWRDLISERVDAPFSHIAEARGFRDKPETNLQPKG